MTHRHFRYAGGPNPAPLSSSMGCPAYYLSLRNCSIGEISVDEILNIEQKDVVRREVLVCEADRVYKTIMENAYGEFDMEKSLDQASISLSTDLVAEVLSKLHYEEKIAFRFFMWAGSQDNYYHEPQVYNEMIDILSSTKYKVKQFRIVCDMLDYMKRNDKKSVPVDVLLKILRQYTEKYLTHVQKFTKKKRIRVKTQPEINAFNMLLDAFCKCCLVDRAEAMFKKVKSKIKPDANTYNILFFGWCRIRNPRRGMKLLDEMISLGFTPDNFTYNTAIDTFSRLGMIDEAVELFKFMKERGSTLSSPTAKSYSIIILALVKHDRIDDSFRMLEDMLSTGCLPDVTTYKDLIEGMCSAGKIDEAYRLLDETGKSGYPPDIVTYNCFLKVLCDDKRKDEAFSLFKRMIEVGVEPSVHTFNMLIEMFFALGEPELAFKTWNEMDLRRCHQDINTYCMMIQGLFGCGKVDDAYGLLEEVVSRGMKVPYRTFDVFLEKLSELGNLHGIHRLSEHMRRFYNPAMSKRFAVSQKRRSMSLRAK
ncbi:hypothetical protein V2J09_015511 [Rumex salicifolius]